jgi:hypothetical protein
MGKTDYGVVDVFEEDIMIPHCSTNDYIFYKWEDKKC